MSSGGVPRAVDPEDTGVERRWLDVPGLDMLRRRSWGRYTGRKAYGRSQYVLVIAFLGVIAAIDVGAVSTDPTQYNVNLWLIYTIVTLGFYWVFGLAGKFAFCQTFMMALGAYTSAWVTETLGAGWFLVGLVTAMIGCALVALVIGLTVARAQEFYFAIATLAVMEVGLVVFREAKSFTGPNGVVTDVTIPSIGGREIASQFGFFWLLLAIVGILLILAVLIERSPVRRDAIAARERRLVARTLGVRTMRVELVLFMLGSSVGGLAGALLGHSTGLISTSSYGIQLAIGIFLMLLLGGMYSIWGAALGAAFYVVVPLVLQVLQGFETIVYGGVLLVVIILLPEGLVGLWRRLWLSLAGMLTGRLGGSIRRLWGRTAGGDSQ